MAKLPTPTGQHHLVIIQKIQNTNGFRVPVLYLQTEKGPELMHTLLKYFLANPSKSLTWMRTNARAIGLFWDYCIAVKKNPTWTSDDPHRDIIRLFTLALLKGTINHETHEDSTKLFWPPTSFRSTKRLTSSLTNFIYWCNDEGLIKTNTAKNLMPHDETTTISFLHTANFIKNCSLLSHTKNKQNIAKNLESKKREGFVNLDRTPYCENNETEAISFPEEFVDPFFEHGFILDKDSDIPEHREDITAKMIALLIFFGGTRKTEPLHLWFNDIVPDTENKCRVFLRHPCEALTYFSGTPKKTRRMYLNEINLLPRNESLIKSYRAGWKNLKTDRNFNAPVFFNHDGIEYLFREMFIYYLGYRERLLRFRRTRNITDHPFLFVSSGTDYSKNTFYAGEPYSQAAFDKAWNRAIARTEKHVKTKIPRGKFSGTTPHGGRHYYGRTLSENGVDKKTIQACLRHRSILSQNAYTSPTSKFITDELEKAKKMISENPRISVT